jgi:hypothetical protein
MAAVVVEELQEGLITTVIHQEHGPVEAFLGIVLAINRPLGFADVLLPGLSLPGDPLIRKINLDKGREYLSKGVPAPRLGQNINDLGLNKHQLVLCCAIGDEVQLTEWAILPN